MTEIESQRRLVELGEATGLWVLVASIVGYGALVWGPACSGSGYDDYEPLGSGAAAVCGGTFPFTPIFLTFALLGLVALAALLLLWGGTRRRTTRLCAAVASVPLLAFAVLQGISLLP